MYCPCPKREPVVAGPAGKRVVGAGDAEPIVVFRAEKLVLAPDEEQLVAPRIAERDVEIVAVVPIDPEFGCESAKAG